jgi:pyridoxamine 5'-phosphate oxidase
MTDDRSRDAGGMNVSDLRRSATGNTLERSDLDDDPVRQFAAWFREACSADTLDPNAASLSTVDAENRPSCRTVLLKYFDARGFTFFTNQSSNKATQIAGNDSVALLFFWRETARQVAICGSAQKLSAAETLRYFLSRPRGSQLGAWVSPQSSVISSRALLDAKFDEMKRKFTNKEVPLPSFWGGYRVVPREMEFWQGRENRLHDRFLYQLQDDARWAIERLAP